MIVYGPFCDCLSVQNPGSTKPTGRSLVEDIKKGSSFFLNPGFRVSGLWLGLGLLGLQYPEGPYILPLWNWAHKTILNYYGLGAQLIPYIYMYGPSRVYILID